MTAKTRRLKAAVRAAKRPGRRHGCNTRSAARTPGRFNRFNRRHTWGDPPDMCEDVTHQAFERSANTPQWADALYDTPVSVAMAGSLSPTVRCLE